jgi:hypothetical protein
MVKNKRDVYRQWLNPISSGDIKSFVIADVDHGDYEDHELTIGDCYKSITLTFSNHRKNKGKMLAKLEKIRTAIDKIEEALLAND